MRDKDFRLWWREEVLYQQLKTQLITCQQIPFTWQSAKGDKLETP